MHAMISTQPAAGDDGGHGHPDIADLVARTERIEALTPLAIMACFVGMPLVTTLIKGHPIMAVINAVMLGLIGTMVVRIVCLIVLAPLRALRFARAARALDAALADQLPTGAIRHRWSDCAPGAIAVARTGHALLVDRSTGYLVRRLEPGQIAGVDVVTDATVKMVERRRPGIMVGMPLGGLVGGLTLSGRAKTTTRIAERHDLALRYQSIANGIVTTSLIPFGSDRDGAFALKLLIDRMGTSDQASARASIASA